MKITVKIKEVEIKLKYKLDPDNNSEKKIEELSSFIHEASRECLRVSNLNSK